MINLIRNITADKNSVIICIKKTIEMELQARYTMIGLMSGTSLDGLDIVNVLFKKFDGAWEFTVLHAETIAYPVALKNKLKDCTRLSGLALKELDVELGVFFGESVQNFMKRYKIDVSEVTAVSNHGHTVFHEPQKGITLQIGNGPQGAVVTELPWVCDFRTQDVARKGNGAPLVPVGDALLFSSEAESFLNLGGFSNISFKKEGKWFAYDICPANLIFNYFAQHFKREFDFGGVLANGGVLNKALFEKLNDMPYYQMKGPKSLGVEWLSTDFMPIIQQYPVNNDTIFTVYHHVAFQLVRVLNKSFLASVFVTGGGAKNAFLIQLLESYYNGEVIVPDERIVDFKEAIVFAFLGLLRIREEKNVLASVTGASKDSFGGYIHLG